MKARQLFRHKDRQDALALEMVLWQLPARSDERPHGLKYRLYCGRNGECLVRYDNEASKGDHRHYGSREENYRFVSLEQLLSDFREDCARIAGWRWE
ncbi:MAG: hypothetical protein IDH49_14320 [Gammaproteobacteria bacterium]|nr:hypothetical protein [Gammaproteobacteria bacterium]